MEAVQRDYVSQGVRFVYVYKALAHPETNGFIAPFSLEERLMHIAEAKKRLGTRFEWLCDTMDNDAKHALGNRPNSEFIIDPQGRVVVARTWSNPDQLRSDLAELVGEVLPATRVSDLGLPERSTVDEIPSGVVQRVSPAASLSPLKIKPIKAETSAASAADPEPYYVKLRAEGSRQQLYLGFFLDPLYEVHWNNEAPRLRYVIEPPAGVSVKPSRGEGPKVDVPADRDPREFLLELEGRSNDPLIVTVSYFACDDAGTFCKQVTQRYHVFMERDPDGGSRRTASGRRTPGRGAQRGGPGRGRPPFRRPPPQ